MRPYSIRDLCFILEASPHRLPLDFEVHSVSVDTRKPIPEGSLFFALVGDLFDAHDFLYQIDGKAIPVVEHPISSPHLLVKNTTVALQRLAAHYRGFFKGTLVAITGSHGKTITKEILFQALQHLSVYRSPGSYNSQIGVALSLLACPLDMDVALIEVGIGKAGDMASHIAMCRPDMVVMTSVGQAHLSGFDHSLQAIAHEKFLLARTASVAILPDIIDPNDGTLRVGNPYRYWVVAQQDSVFSRFLTPNLAFFADYLSKLPFFLEGTVLPSDSGSSSAGIDLVIKGDVPYLSDGLYAHLESPAHFMVSNAVCAAAAAMLFGVSTLRIKESLACFSCLPMRIEIQTSPLGVTVVNDSYISDPTSARHAIDTLVRYAGESRSIAVLGSMGDLGESSASEEAEKLVSYAISAGVSQIFYLGLYAKKVHDRAVLEGFKPQNLFLFSSLDNSFEESKSLLQRTLLNQIRPGDVVLFKASHKESFDALAQMVLGDPAPTRLEVRINALNANVSYVRRLVGKDVKIMAMVKSFAYGSDATKIAKVLRHQSIDAFGVAYPDEGAELRRAGIHLPILVMNVISAQASAYIEHDLTPVLWNRDVAQVFNKVAALANIILPVQVEIDTGMHRLGCDPDDALDFCLWLEKQTHLRLTGIMTHFATADDVVNTHFSETQTNLFMEVVNQVQLSLGRPLLAHAANTAAILRMPHAHFNMVRVGIGLYGIAPGPNMLNCDELVPVLRLVTTVLRVTHVCAGESVGYGCTWVAARNSIIATIAIGYNDGFRRFMSNGGLVLIHGELCPVVGNVCMDNSMVDVTELASEVSLGDEVVLFGFQWFDSHEHVSSRPTKRFLPIEKMANRGNTIPYEILTGISSRVRRVYIDDDKAG